MRKIGVTGGERRLDILCAYFLTISQGRIESEIRQFCGIVLCRQHGKRIARVRRHER
jgi:hypothetical protein